MVYWWYTGGILVVYWWYTGVYWWYTGGILVVYHQYTTNAFTCLDQGFCFHMVVQWKFFHFQYQDCIAVHCLALHCIAVHCLALHCIALHYIVQSEAHFNLKLTALRSMRVQWIFLFLVFSLRLLCIALHCIVQSEVHFNLKLTALRSMRIQWNCFFLCSVWNAFQVKPNSTEIYENYVFVFQHVMHFSLSLRFALQEQEKDAQDEIKYI